MGTGVCRRRRVMKDRNPQGLKRYWPETLRRITGLKTLSYKEETTRKKPARPRMDSPVRLIDLLGRQLSLSAVVRSGC